MRAYLHNGCGVHSRHRADVYRESFVKHEGDRLRGLSARCTLVPSAVCYQRVFQTYCSWIIRSTEAKQLFLIYIMRNKRIYTHYRNVSHREEQRSELTGMGFLVASRDDHPDGSNSTVCRLQWNGRAIAMRNWRDYPADSSVRLFRGGPRVNCAPFVSR